MAKLKESVLGSAVGWDLEGALPSTVKGKVLPMVRWRMRLEEISD